LHALKQGAGAVKVDSLLAEIDKLEQIEALELPAELFREVPPRVVESYRQRVAVEDLHEVQRHPDAVRYTLLAAFCWQRREILTPWSICSSTPIHRLGIRRTQGRQGVLREIKRVRGKHRLLYEIAEVLWIIPTGR
jgi:hypothetical protein